jgi:hypothetical protein
MASINFLKNIREGQRSCAAADRWVADNVVRGSKNFFSRDLGEAFPLWKLSPAITAPIARDAWTDTTVVILMVPDLIKKWCFDPFDPFDKALLRLLGAGNLILPE